MITHIVLIQWKSDASSQAIEAVVEAAADLRKIEGVIDVGIHRNLGVANPQYGRGIGHVFIIKLSDMQALEVFRPHPIHRTYGQKFHPIAAEVTIVDLEE